jgi:putative flippase GtrA
VSATSPSLIERLRGAIDILIREVIKFGVVGAVAFVVDIGLFNLLRFGGGEGPLYDKPLTAKIISVAVATFVAWLGNRYWTFRHRRRTQAAHELALFVAFNVVGMLIALACLGFSHYVLDLRSPLADNISANGVGLVLGTLFRFWAYRTFVFSRDELLEDTSPLAHHQDHKH